MGWFNTGLGIHISKKGAVWSEDWAQSGVGCRSFRVLTVCGLSWQPCAAATGVTSFQQQDGWERWRSMSGFHWDSQLIPLPGGSPRNSLEVLTPEVPGERDRGNCITSLQLHPKGWATLLRCSSNTDDQEVTHYLVFFFKIHTVRCIFFVVFLKMIFLVETASSLLFDVGRPATVQLQAADSAPLTWPRINNSTWPIINSSVTLIAYVNLGCFGFVWDFFCVSMYLFGIFFLVEESHSL